MKLHSLAMLAMALAIPAGWAQAEETTRVYRQGNSTATITQSGGGSSTVIHRTVDGPDSQTIVQSQSGNTAAVTQGSGRTMGTGMARSRLGLDREMSEDLAGDVSRMQVVVSLGAADQAELRELASEEDTTVEALVEEAIQDLLDSY
jgi:hypothetical protein